MADQPNQPDETPKKSKASDLKARLGLKKKKRSAPLAPQSKRQAALPPPAVKPTEESIAEARARAAAADAKAGPAIEDFSVIGSDNTPVPQSLPRVEYVSVGAETSYPGKDKKIRTMLVALGVGVGIVAFFLGTFVSGASLRNELRDRFALEAKEKIDLLDSHQETFDRIGELGQLLDGVLEQADAVFAQEDGDILVLEPAFAKLRPALEDYIAKRTYFDPEVSLGPTLYNGVLMKDVIAFAMSTRFLYNDVRNALDEVRSYAKFALPPAETTLGVLAQPASRDVEGIGTIPIATGAFIKRPGPPQKVELKDARGRTVGHEYHMMVILEGEAEPIQVRTNEVMQLDLKNVYDWMTTKARRVTIQRLYHIAKRLRARAQAVNVPELRAAISEWINPDAEKLEIKE